MKIVDKKGESRRIKMGILISSGARLLEKPSLLKLVPVLILVKVLALSLFSFSSSVYAQATEDPLAPKPNLMWLSEDVNVSVFGNNEYDSFLGKSEIWTDNWGVSAKLLQNDNQDVFGLPKDSTFFNFDVKHRVFGSQDKSNIELGLGWQEFDIDSQLDASGPKVSLSGR